MSKEIFINWKTRRIVPNGLHDKSLDSFQNKKLNYFQKADKLQLNEIIKEIRNQ